MSLPQRVTKTHATGNDFVVYLDKSGKFEPTADEVRFLCDRHFGIGGDGLIRLTRPDFVSDLSDDQLSDVLAGGAKWFMDYRNADGSLAEMCGNGIRCVAKYVYDKGLTDKTTFTIETLSGIKTIDVTLKDGKVAEASVDMGKPVLKCTDIPMISDHFVFVDQGLVIAEDVVYNGTAVSMGNPHFVTFVDDVDSLDLEKLGPLFEHHKLFPEGVNTEFVQVIDKNTVKFRVWERGSGETWACGTGTCATVAALTELGVCPAGEDVHVQLRGGELIIRVLPGKKLLMTGSAVTVCEGIAEV